MGDTVNSALAASWLTAIVFVISPPETVIVAFLVEVKAFAAAVIMKVSFPLPLVLLTVAQVSLEETVQSILLATVIVEVPPEAGGL